MPKPKRRVVKARKPSRIVQNGPSDDSTNTPQKGEGVLEADTQVLKPRDEGPVSSVGLVGEKSTRQLPTPADTGTGANDVSSPSKKRAREDEGEKVEHWLTGLAQSTPSVSAAGKDEEKSPRKKLRAMKPATERALSQSVHELVNMIYPSKYPERPQTTPTPKLQKLDPTPKDVRRVLRRMAEHVDTRTAFMEDFEETEAAVKGALKYIKRLEEEVLELVWTRYCIEEDVLKKMKRERTLVDGTAKLGRGNIRGEMWTKWLADNTNPGNPPQWWWSDEERNSEAGCA